MATELQVQYVINATLGKLDALSQLHNQLVQLQALAKEGADFGVRIDPTGLNGIRESIARAVAAGVKDAGLRVRAPGATGGGSGSGATGAMKPALSGGEDTDIATLSSQMRRLRQTLKKMTGALNTGESAIAQTFQTVEELEKQVEYRRKSVVAWQRRLSGLRQLEAGREGSGTVPTSREAFTDLYDRAVGGAQALGKGRRRQELEAIKKIADNFAKSQRAPEAEAAINALRSKVDQLTRTAGGQSGWMTKQLKNAEEDLDIVINNRRQAEVRRAGGIGSTGGGVGLAINQAQLNAAFIQAADAFASRVSSQLALNFQSNTHGAPAMATGGGFNEGGSPAYSTPVMGSSGLGQLGYKQCRKCHGKGTIGNGMVCFKCGGTGDENHPNFQAAVGAGANPQWVGNRMSNPIDGAAVAPIIPHSEGRREEVLTKLSKMDFVRRTGKTKDLSGNPIPMSPEERAKLESNMAPLIEELEQGGVPRLRYAKSANLVNGVFATDAEMQRMKNTEATSAPFMPKAADGSIKWAANDPLRMATTHVNELASAITSLNKVDIKHVQESFGHLAESLREVARDMSAIKGQMGSVVPQQAELHYTRLLNAEKERHATQARTRDADEKALREGQRVMAQADRLRRADELNGLRGGMDLPPNMLDPDRLSKRIGSQLRRMGRMDERLDDLRMASAASGGNSYYDNQRVRIGAERMGLRSTILRQALRLSDADPTRLGIDPAALRAQIAQEEGYMSAAGAMGRFQRYSQAAKLYGRDPKKFANEYHDALTGRDVAFGDLQKAGIADKKTGVASHDVDSMLGALASKRADVEKGSQSLLKQIAIQHDVNEAAAKSGAGFNLLGKKMKDLAAYMIAGGILYGAINTTTRALRETMKFESDMADVQGIFIAKTQAQRDAVKFGVMGLAGQYGADRSQVAGVAKMFAQTGASPDKTLTLTSAALLAQKGAGLNIDQASEMLIAVDNITKGSVKPTDIIDRISRVEARHAVTGQDLSAILQKAAPMAAMMQPNQLGTIDSLDALMGMGTTLIEKTRMSGSAAGTTLKFLMARLSAPQVQRKLQDQFGINLGGSSPDQMRSMTDIFGDIASKYQDYQKTGQSGKAAALLTSFAGARQANAAASIFDDWKGTMDVARESSLAFGDAQRRLSIQMDTLETKTGQLGVAFQNFATNMLEQSGILSALKMGAGAGKYLLDQGAKNPGLSLLGSGAALYGIGRATVGAAAGGSFANYGMLGAAAPTLGTIGMLAGGAAVGFGAFTVARNTMMKDQWDAMREQEKYGATGFDRSTYTGSEQGKDYLNTAGRFGLSGEGLYSAVTSATAFAQAQAEQKFGKGFFGENAKTNPALGKFLEEKLVERLKETVPAFKDIKDQAEATATALEILRKSAQYGGVSYYAEQGKFQEDSHSLRQEFLESMQASPTAATRDMLGRAQRFHYEMALGPVSSYGVGKRTNLATLSAHDLGMLYSDSIATQMGHTTSASRVDDIKQILNAQQPRLAIGNALGNYRLSGGEMFLTKVDSYLKSAGSLGAALDKAAESIEKLTDADYTHLKVLQEKNKLTGEEAAQLSRGNNYNELVKQMGFQLGISLDSQARREGAKAQGAGGGAASESEVRGGAFVDKIMQAMEDATNQQMKGLDPQDAKFKSLKAYYDAHFTPGNRPQTRLDVMSALNGSGNIKAYLRDRVFDEMLRYGERRTEIGMSSQYLSGTGVGFDALQETSANSQGFLQGLIKVSSQLPTDELRAIHRLSMAAVQRSGFETADYTNPGDLPEEQRNIFTKTMLSAIKKLERKGTLNDGQITSLGVALQAIRGAAKEWSTGKPSQLFDSLGDEAKAKMLSLIGLDNNQLLAAGAGQSEFFLDFARQLTVGDLGKTTQSNMGLADRVSLSNMKLSGVRHGYALRSLDLQRATDVATLNGNYDAVGELRRRGIAANQTAAIGTAQSTYTASMAALRDQAERSGQLDASGNLQGTLLEKANDAANVLKQAVVDANLEAMRGMIDLVNQTHIDYLQRQEAHLKELGKSVAEPFAQILADPKKVLGSGKFGELAGALGAGANQRIASSFINNLVGEGGLFEKRFNNLFNSPLFAEADLIKRAHMDGIMQGFAQVYGFSAGTTVSTGGLGMTSVRGAGSAMSAGLAAAGVGLGGLLGQQLMNTGMGGSELNNVADASFSLGGGGGGSPTSRKQAVLTQMATLASIYASTAIFGGNGIKGRNGQPNNYGAEGAQLGSMVGSMIPGVGPIVGPVLGSLFGGLIGSRFGKGETPLPPPEFEALAKIERNTRETVDSITNQTRSLLSPENRLLFAPSSFQMPDYRPFDAGSSKSVAGGGGDLPPIVINVNGADNPQLVAETVAAHLREQLSGYGSYTDPRF